MAAAELLVFGADECFQLVALLLGQYRFAVLQRFDPQISEFGAEFFRLLDLALELNQIRRGLLHQAGDLFFNRTHLLMQRRHLVLVVGADFFQAADLIAAQI
jgi:hypothetical protein